MVDQGEVGNSLHQRVTNYLRDTPVVYAHEESETEALEAVFNTLLEAEETLQAAQERVDLLKWELAKLRS